MSNINLARENMPALAHIRNEFLKNLPFKDLKIGMALHVTKETAILVETLVAGGAQVAITGCNPLSTQNDVAEEMASWPNVKIWAKHGQSKEEYYQAIENVLDTNPDLVIDDGCDLIFTLHTNPKYAQLLNSLIGGAEETTTGVVRVQAMAKDNALKFPVVAVNDNQTKHLMDNYYGTGQSTIDAVLRASNTLLAGKTVVVAGYGSCGKGVAIRAHGMGAKIIVTEVDQVRALQAHMDGFSVAKMDECVSVGDIFITVTGCKDVLNVDQIQKMKPGAILANSGHFNVEIQVDEMYEAAVNNNEIRPNFRKFEFKNGTHVYLVGEGRLANLVAAEGHPSEVMDLSFCGQAFALKFLVENRGSLKPEVYTLPPEVDQEIGKLKLATLGISIDQLTSDQLAYVSDWQSGT